MVFRPSPTKEGDHQPWWAGAGEVTASYCTVSATPRNHLGMRSSGFSSPWGPSFHAGPFYTYLVCIQVQRGKFLFNATIAKMWQFRHLVLQYPPSTNPREKDSLNPITGLLACLLRRKSTLASWHNFQRWQLRAEARKKKKKKLKKDKSEKTTGDDAGFRSHAAVELTGQSLELCGHFIAKIRAAISNPRRPMTNDQ